MSDPLHLSGARFEAWGGASGRELLDLTPGFTVVLGDNETGKSSIAAALSLLLAGGGTAGDFALYGNHGDRLDVELTARIGDSELQTALTTTLNKRTGKHSLKIERSYHLDGDDLSEEQFSELIGKVNLEDFRARYWITAKEILTEPEIPDDKLSVRHIIGFDPFAKARELQEKARDFLESKEKKKNSALLMVGKASSASEGLEKAREAGKSVDQISARLEKITSKIDKNERKQTETKESIGHLENAREALTLYSELNSLLGSDLGSDAPSKDQHTMAAARERVTVAIERLDSAQTDTASAASNVEQARRDAGDWADLVDRLDTAPKYIRGLNTADAKVRACRALLDKALVDQAATDRDRGPNAENTDRSLTARAATASILLALGALISLIMDYQTTAQILGMGAAAVAAVVLMSRGRSRETGHPMAGTNVAGLEEGLRLEVEQRTAILADTGVPADRIPKQLDEMGESLWCVAKFREARDSHEKDVERRREQETKLLALLPPDTALEQAGMVLDAACLRVDAHQSHLDKVDGARRKLTEALGGTKTTAEQLLDNFHPDQLKVQLDNQVEFLAKLEGEISDQKDEKESKLTKKAAADAHSDIEKLGIELAALRGPIRDKLVDGLAHKLAGQVLEESADKYLGDNTPEIFGKAEAYAKRIAQDWVGLELDKTSNDGLRIRSRKGTYAKAKLSLGGRSGLNFALRLATAETESSKLPVRLPLLLDDPLVHVDDVRRPRAFQVIGDLAKNHQVLYFTCHRQHANEAIDAGARLVELGEAGD